jgi:hypothetical protein
MALVPMIPLGLMNESASINTVLGFYFLSIIMATYSFDLMLYGFECLPKNNRDNYVIILAATRVVGVTIVALCFYFFNKWAYFIIVQFILTAVLLGIFTKKAFESPLQVMVSTGDHDMCKFILNSIAIINEEDIVHEALAFNTTK